MLNFPKMCTSVISHWNDFLLTSCDSEETNEPKDCIVYVQYILSPKYWCNISNSSNTAANMDLTSYLQFLIGKEVSPRSPGVGSFAASLLHLETGAHTKPSVHCALHTHMSACSCHSKYFKRLGVVFPRFIEENVEFQSLNIHSALSLLRYGLNSIIPTLFISKPCSKYQPLQCHHY